MRTRWWLLCASVALAPGCASLRLPAPRLTPAQCTIDRALVGTWTDARLTQLGPAWVKYSLAGDCSFSTRIQLLWMRITERGQYRVTGDQIQFERASGPTTVPYRLDHGRLYLTDAPGEEYAYRRRDE